MDIGKKIKLARKSKGMTQSQLALQLKVTKQAVSQYEKNKIKISKNQFEQIAKILKKPLNYFLKEKSNDTIFEKSDIQISIGKRIKLARIGKGLTQKQIAKKLGVSQGTINKYELSLREISLSKLKKIAEIFNTPLPCLICEDKEYICKSYIIHIKKMIYIPIFKNFKKGELLEVAQLPIVAYLPIEEKQIKNEKISGALQVMSDSMEPKILKDTYVILNNQTIIEEGNIALIYFKEQGTIIREVHFIRYNMIKLISFNKKYPVKCYKIKDLRILGKIVGNLNYSVQYWE